LLGPFPVVIRLLFAYTWKSFWRGRSVEKERERNTIAIMAAILLLPKMKELFPYTDTKAISSPKVFYAISEAIRLAEVIYAKVRKS
jgi:hypothetical protein